MATTRALFLTDASSAFPTPARFQNGATYNISIPVADEEAYVFIVAAPSIFDINSFRNSLHLSSSQLRPQTRTYLIQQLLSNLPLHFEPNVGQASRDVKYVIRARQYVASFDAQHFSLALRSLGHVIRTTFVGASESAQLIAAQPMAGQVNYFLGSDPAQWHSAVPTFAQLRVSDLYPGVDVVYRSGRDGNLRYDLHVTPGASLEQVQLAFDGLSAAPYVDSSSGALVLPMNGNTY